MICHNCCVEVVVAIITGVLTLSGTVVTVIAGNRKTSHNIEINQAVTNEKITELTGKTPREIYNQQGAAAFMQAEEEACSKIIEEFKNQKIVISTGGGICDNAPALELLSQFGTFIFLKTPEEVSANRIINKAEQLSDGTWKNLPAYISNQNPKSEKEVRQIFHTFYVARVEIYSKIADKTIKLKSDSKENNLKLIMENL